MNKVRVEDQQNIYQTALNLAHGQSPLDPFE